MIYLGFNKDKKIKIINNYIKKNNINKIYFLSNEKLNVDFDDIEYVSYNDIIEYKYYYRIIENTTNKTLIILNEIHKNSNRYNLFYNCIRTFLNSTKHKLIFNFLPIIYNREDFCSLIDFETRSRYKYLKFDAFDFKDISIFYKKIYIILNKIKIKNTGFFDDVDKDYSKEYFSYKENLFANINQKEPHTLPRNLQLFTSKIKLNYISEKCISRIRQKNTVSINSTNEKLKIIDLPYNMNNLISYIYNSKNYNLDIITTNLKVDLWFESRVEKMIEEINYVYNRLQQ